MRCLNGSFPILARGEYSDCLAVPKLESKLSRSERRVCTRENTTRHPDSQYKNREVNAVAAVN
jgi:hypothetical protein